MLMVNNIIDNYFKGVCDYQKTSIFFLRIRLKEEVLFLVDMMIRFVCVLNLIVLNHKYFVAKFDVELIECIDDWFV